MRKPAANAANCCAIDWISSTFPVLTVDATSLTSRTLCVANVALRMIRTPHIVRQRPVLNDRLTAQQTARNDRTQNVARTLTDRHQRRITVDP